MSDEQQEKLKPVFIIVPRKLVVTALTLFICMVVLTSVSVSWANYVDKRSNQRWCGVVVLFDNTYRDTPPTTDVGKQLAAEFRKLRNEFDCN